MIGQELTYWVAFINGLASFFTPCVLPLLPLYFSYLAGTTIQDIAFQKDARRNMIINSFAFVIGLSILNIMLGFGAKAINTTLVQYEELIRKVGGVLIMILGLYFIGLFKLPFLDREHKYHYRKFRPNVLSSLILGITFSVGWTPCNGPIVGTILFLASFEKDYLQAGGLMSIYSLGFAIPFLLSALLFGKFIHHYKKVFTHFNKIKWVAGILMIIMGIMLYTNSLSLLVIGGAK